MARKKKTTREKSGGGLFGFLKKKKKPAERKRKAVSSDHSGLKVMLSVMIVTLLIAGGLIGLLYLERYTMGATEQTSPMGTVVFKERPAWLNQEWIDWVQEVLGGNTFVLNEDSAAGIGRKLEATAWLKHIRVETTPVEIQVYADHRRPVGLVKSGSRQYYIADDMTVMNFIPMPTLNIAELKGVSSGIPEVGQGWLAEDAKAAIEILKFLYTMDLQFQREGRIEKPLLSEIATVDVSNFAARRNRSAPNIILTVKDGTKIHWGAAWGQSAVYMEAEEKDKLTRLYQHYMDYKNSLQGTAKIIELRWPEDRIPRPR